MKQSKVADATEPYTVTIIHDDECGAERLCPRRCVMAKCLRRILPKNMTNFRSVQVGEKKTKMILNDGTTIIYSTPKNLADDIKKFDSGEPWPFEAGKDSATYTLGVPNHLSRTPAQIQKQKERDAARSKLGLATKGTSSHHKMAGTTPGHTPLSTRELTPWRSDELDTPKGVKKAVA